MKTFRLSLAGARDYFQRQKSLGSTDTYVIEWRDRSSGEVYNVTGKQWAGQSTSAGQVLKYVTMLYKKAEFVAKKKTGTQAFAQFILEQNDGVHARERGTGFASRFPNGVELDVELAVSEFTHPKESPRAAELYKTLRARAEPHCRVSVLVDKEQYRQARMITPREDIVIEAGAAKNISVLRAAA